jgi:hypothetical protein
VDIGRALLVNETLTTLNLHLNSIGAEGARRLGKALRVNCVLSALMLGENRIGRGWKHLAEALHVNRVFMTLRCLRLDEYDDDDDAGEEDEDVYYEVSEVRMCITR